MDHSYISALAALAGSLIGGLTTLSANWLTQHAQFRAQRVTQDTARREELYKSFIEEASRLYADAFESEKENPNISKLVDLYALVSRMRVRSSSKVVANADDVVKAIIQVYLEPKKTFRDLSSLVAQEAMDPLRRFSNACREEFQGPAARAPGPLPRP
jgi:hypothetical protein